MLRILVVEDQIEKRAEIIAHLLSCSGLHLTNVSHADNVHDAKRMISTYRFDLLVLDLNIPGRADELPRRDAGLEIMSFVRTNLRAKAPGFIFGMTGYEESFVAASAEFSSALWKLVRYSSDDKSWKAALSGAVDFLQTRHMPPYANDGVTYHIDVGIVLALEEELTPYRSLISDLTETRVPHDPTRYFVGRLDSSPRPLSVALIVCPRMGLPAAAVSASKLIFNFRPEFLLCTGICAGVKSKTEFGDVLIADPSFDWGSGKWVGEDDVLRFLPAAYPWRPDESLRSEMISLCSSGDVLARISHQFRGKKTGNTPKLLTDAMASGGAVLQSQDLMREIRDQHKNLVGVDMENYAVITAAEYCGEPKPKVLTIKAVCDFGDGEKHDNYHEFAAHMSASLAIEFLKAHSFRSS